MHHKRQEHARSNEEVDPPPTDRDLVLSIRVRRWDGNRIPELANVNNDRRGDNGQPLHQDKEIITGS